MGFEGLEREIRERRRDEEHVHVVKLTRVTEHRDTELAREEERQEVRAEHGAAALRIRRRDAPYEHLGREGERELARGLERHGLEIAVVTRRRRTERSTLGERRSDEPNALRFTGAHRWESAGELRGDVPRDARRIDRPLIEQDYRPRTTGVRAGVGARLSSFEANFTRLVVRPYSDGCPRTHLFGEIDESVSEVEERRGRDRERPSGFEVDPFEDRQEPAEALRCRRSKATPRRRSDSDHP